MSSVQRGHGHLVRGGHRSYEIRIGVGHNVIEQVLLLLVLRLRGVYFGNVHLPDVVVVEVAAVEEIVAGVSGGCVATISLLDTAE